MAHPTPRRTTIVFTVLLLTSASAVVAQVRPERILHEYFKTPNIAGVSGARDGVDGEGPPQRERSRDPNGEPSLTLDPKDDEPVLGADGPKSSVGLDNPQGGLNPLEAANPLDDRTDKVDELNYFSAFDPSVIPYKRMVSQNRVTQTPGGDYVFGLEQGTVRRVRMDSAPKRADEDVFWGTFLLRTEPGKLHPIPSVAPSQRIMEVRTEPSMPVEFVRDAADNFYVRASSRALVRMNVKISVPRYYFDGTFRRDVMWTDFRRGLVAELPPKAQAAARRVRAHLGLNAPQSPEQTLVALVKHFRDFQGDPFPDELRGEDVYESIAKNKIGVCRHRSFAFAITANSMGIPARYVYNEAHAFVEVHWPGQGWRRIDLGGAAEEVLMRAGEQDTRVHAGGVDDVLPEPPAYLDELERLAEQNPDHSGSAGAGGRGAENAPTGEPGEEGPMNRIEDPEGAPGDPANASENPDNGDTIDPPERTQTRILLEEHPTSAQRGGTYMVRGRLSLADLDRPLVSRDVRVVLRGGARELEIGRATTDMAGNFATAAQIPKDLPIGRWELIVLFEGDERLAPVEWK